MITKINIQNFKSLEDVTIKCRNLNVLTGLNGMGKSSLIQMLLLLRQSYEKGFLTDEDGGLILNGDLVDIGTAKEALYEFAKKEEINFNIEFKDEGKIIEKRWFFTYEVNQPDKKEEERKYSDSDFMPYSEAEKRPKKLKSLSLFKKNNFKYLNADRWVKNEYGVSDLQVYRYRSLGKHGEYTAHYLNHFGTTPIHEDLLFSGNDVNNLETQVSAWMSEISPGTKVVTARILGSNTVKLRYKIQAEKNSTTELSPLNVGFGITYVLPVLAALLSARSGDILLIENPESHIHPKGQSLIGELMAMVAQTGVQVFVETHSDHVLNGIRVAVKKGVSEKMVNLLFFHRNMKDNNLSTIVDIPVIDNEGGIENWPKDFFDQSNKDLNYLFDI